MKSRKGVLMLLLLVFLNSYGFESAKKFYIHSSPQNSLEKKFPKENLSFPKKLDSIGVQQELAYLEEKTGDLTDEDLRNLSILYAYLQNTEKASHYLQRYIKQALETRIIEHEAFDAIRNSKEFQLLVKQYSLRVDFWVIFLFSCGLIGIFLFIVLNLRKKGDFLANLLISTFVLFHSLFVLHACIFMSRYSYSMPHALYLTTTFSFLYGPLLYFYYRRITEKYRFKWRDILHLIPSVVIILYLSNIYLLPVKDKLFLMFNRDDTSFVELVTIITTKLASLTIYGFLVLGIYKKTKKNRKETKVDPQIVRWQRNMMLLNFAYVLGYLLFAIGRLKVFSSSISIYTQIYLMSFIILYVGYIAYVQPRVFSKKFLFGELTLLKYQKSGLTSSFSEELKEQLLMLLQEEKVFKQSNITLGELAERLETTRHNISQVINQHFGMNFFHLINQYRIEEAKEILKSDQERNLNIIDVAYDVGFNNKVTFNKAFKEQTNMTPSTYIKNLDTLGFVG